MTHSLSRTESWTLLALSAASLGVLANTYQGNGEPLIASIAFSGLAFSLSYALIRWLGDAFMRRGLKGRDMSKPNAREIPETMGAVCAVVYLLAIIFFIPFPFIKDFVAATSGGGNRDLVLETRQLEEGRLLHLFPHNKLASYLSAILSLQSVVILGIGDDLFDIRWRHKVLIPAFASIPMLMVYFVDFGVTKVVVPSPLKALLGDMVDLGWVYYAYMAAICIFCPNSINIVAGINGIEVSQSIVIALLILLNDCIYLYPFDFAQSPSTPSSYIHPATDSHLFSIYLLIPFLGVSFALLFHNWYPSRVFVGDTYCYFAGILFAVVAILGHFSKTLLLLFIPQIFNFIYSAPQLFGLVPCPRHRLPRFNARTGLLEPSEAIFLTDAFSFLADDAHANTTNGSSTNGATKPPSTSLTPTSGRPLHPLTQRALKILHTLRLVRIETDPATGAVTRSSNLTILNLWLVWFGPMREDRLAMGVLAMQVACGLAGLWVRHRLALWVFDMDNR